MALVVICFVVVVVIALFPARSAQPGAVPDSIPTAFRQPAQPGAVRDSFSSFFRQPAQPGVVRHSISSSFRQPPTPDRELDRLLRRADVCLAKHDLDEAIKTCDEAVRLDAKCAAAYHKRGDAWIEKRHYNEAIQDYTAAVRLDVGDAAAYCSRGDAYSRQKIYVNAISDYDQAIRIDSELVLPYANLAWLLATCPQESLRDAKRAITLATKACELTGWSGAFELSILAAAYAEAGRFEEAEQWQAQALQYDPLQGSTSDFYRERLKLYRQKKLNRGSP